MVRLIINVIVVVITAPFRPKVFIRRRSVVCFYFPWVEGDSNITAFVVLFIFLQVLVGVVIVRFFHFVASRVVGGYLRDVLSIF